MANPYSRVLSKDQYLNSFVDFYNQTLGTGISSSVAVDPTEDQDQQQSAGPNIFMGSGEDPSSFITPTITMYDSPEQAMSRATREVAEDRTDSYFKDFNIKEQIKEFYKTDAGKFLSGADLILGADGMLTGAYAIGKGVSELNRRARDRAAYDVYAAGNLAGSTLNVGGQDIIRRPGSTNYIGTVMGDPKQIYAQEQIMYGYIPGTMKESEGGEEEGGNWSRTGFEGLLDAETAKAVGGNYDPYGNFHTANGQSRMGDMKAGKALYEEITGRAGTNAEVAAFMNDFRNNFAAEKAWYTNVWNVKPEDYANARKTTIEKLRDKYGIDSTGTEAPTTTPTADTPSPDSGTTPDYSVPGSTVSESTSDSGDTTYTYSGTDIQGDTVTTTSTYDEAGMNITAPSSTARTAQDDIVGPTSRPEVNISRTSYDNSDNDNNSGGGVPFSGESYSTTTNLGTKVSSNIGGAGEHADIGNYVTEKQKQEKSGGGSDGGGGNDGGCVIATHGISTGGFTSMEKAKAELWCQKTYHGKWYGEAFRRGYRAAGQRCIDRGNAEQHYQEFKDFVSYGRGVKKGYKLAINYYLRTLQFFITGMFLGK